MNPGGTLPQQFPAQQHGTSKNHEHYNHVAKGFFVQPSDQQSRQPEAYQHPWNGQANSDDGSLTE